MSEVRRVVVDLQDVECIETAAKECGLVLEKIHGSENMIVKNHGLRMYGSSQVTLRKVIGKNYELSGDFAGGDGRKLQELANQLMVHYNVSVVTKKAKEKGFTVLKEKSEDGKIKMKLRRFA